jgi:hypothetical protein
MGTASEMFSPKKQKKSTRKIMDGRRLGDEEHIFY